MSLAAALMREPVCAFTFTLTDDLMTECLYETDRLAECKARRLNPHRRHGHMRGRY